MRFLVMKDEKGATEVFLSDEKMDIIAEQFPEYEVITDQVLDFPYYLEGSKRLFEVLLRLDDAYLGDGFGQNLLEYIFKLGFKAGQRVLNNR